MRMTSPAVTPFWHDPDAGTPLRTQSARCVAIAHAQRKAQAAAAGALALPAWQDSAADARSAPDAAAGNDPDVFELALS
jgi:hypothetical protein